MADGVELASHEGRAGQLLKLLEVAKIQRYLRDAFEFGLKNNSDDPLD
jgi:hypothetical protein